MSIHSELVNGTAEEPEVEDADGERDKHAHESTADLKKRKRDTNEEDIEVDLSLPEPPSKKALRKSKKLQKAGKSTNDNVKSAENVVDSAAASSRSKESQGEPEKQAELQKDSKPSKSKSQYSIWIGNLPFAATKSMLSDFLTKNSEPQIKTDSISRIHVPAPANAVATKTRIKPMNRGFAYVDFEDQESFMAALALSETVLGGRNLLIKDAKSFEGRPEEHGKAKKSLRNEKSSRRIFVGNLGFDVTQEELQSLFRICGDIEHAHMATFQDSGKCKGYAWITFVELESAQHAVRGWVHQLVNDSASDDDSEESETEAQAKKTEKRQVFCNRLHGREIRREFAEDPTIRYNKRFGKGRNVENTEEPAITEMLPSDTSKTQQSGNTRPKKGEQTQINPGAPTDPSKRRGKTGSQSQPRSQSEASQKMVERTQYRRGPMTGGSGSRITFD